MSRCGADDGWRIDTDSGDAEAYRALAADRLWNGYSIADLEPPFRDHARAALARRKGGPQTAVCMLLRHPSFNSLIPHGDEDGLAAILAVLKADELLPEETFILSRQEHLAIVERYYRFPNGPMAMLRLAVVADSYRPPGGAWPTVSRLTADDLSALSELYASYSESVFNADQLASGVYYGIREGGLLVAAAGTHVVARQYGIGAVGNVYTSPGARGRGYGGAVTAAVVAELLADPCREVICNVAVANGAARRLYERLGFREHCQYWEGYARLLAPLPSSRRQGALSSQAVASLPSPCGRGAGGEGS